ncbi:putative tRNA-intron lyase [Helianthus annuus]|nr:putative tRNA-intron lyase [Helianthus annuus]
MKSNGISHGTNHSSPKPSGESVNIRKVETSVEKQETLGVKITDQETFSPIGKSPKPEPSNSSPVSAASGSASHEENVNAGLHMSSNTNSFRSPINIQRSQVVMGPRWKGKGSEAKALANPISNSISDLQSSLLKSNSQGILSGCSVLLATNPQQTELLNQTCFGRPIITVDKHKQWFQFTLEEAFYLCFSLSCMKIVDGDHILKSNDELWEYMVSKQPYFVNSFKAYSHLRVKNWVVRSGCQYGVDFVAYRHHPSLVHSEYGVLVFSDGNANNRLRVWSDFQCTLRLCGSVAKTLLILHVNRNGENGIGSCSSPSCLDRFSVDERTITRWSPERCREDQHCLCKS